MNLKTLNIFSLVLIMAGAIAMFFFSKKCNNPHYEITDTVTVTDTFYVTDTFKSTDTFVITKPGEVIYVDVHYEIDTAEVLKRFYAHVLRHDTLRNDSGVFISLEQEITKNDVIKQILHLEDYEQTKIVTNEVTITKVEKAPKFFAGAFLGIQTKVPTAGLSFTMMTAKQRLLSCNVGYPQTFYVNFQMPLRQKKK